MTSFRRIEANRRNALRSTGPRTEEGKRSSRANAYRHGLTAETVVPDVEDEDDYAAFEAAVIADYDARTAVERELVLRLASLCGDFAGRRRSGPTFFRYKRRTWPSGATVATTRPDNASAITCHGVLARRSRGGARR